jgi:hypothetical protein
MVLQLLELSLDIVGCVLFVMLWEAFNGPWKRLPENVRMGLCKLGVAVFVPWGAWFGYAALNAVERHRDPSGAVMALLIPVGAPFFMLAVLWIISGFKGSDARPADKKPMPADAKVDG